MVTHTHTHTSQQQQQQQSQLPSTNTPTLYLYKREMTISPFWLITRMPLIMVAMHWTAVLHRCRAALSCVGVGRVALPSVCVLTAVWRHNKAHSQHTIL